jgi:hypothetical protein
MRRSPRHLMFAIAALVVFAAAATACGGDSNDDISTSTATTAAPTSAKAATSGSASIEELQRELDTLGCNAGPTDGELGSDTRGAIRTFQSAAGLTVDGIVGPVTRRALSQAASTGRPNCDGVTTPTEPAPSTTPSGGPQCTPGAIEASAQAALLPGESIVKAGPFQCSGIWAVNSPTITSAGQQVQVTNLVMWNGSAWQVVDRAIYCENGSVPPLLYPSACQSN